MITNNVVNSCKVTRLAAELATVLWPSLSETELVDVNLAYVARSMEYRLCDVNALVRQLIEAGVVQGILRDGRCRLKRGLGNLRVVASLQDEACEMLYLNGAPPVVKVDSSAGRAGRSRDNATALLTEEEFQFACLLWSMGMTPGSALRRREIIKQAVERDFPASKAASLLTQLVRYDAVSVAGRGERMDYKFRGVGAKCLTTGSTTFRRYDGTET